MRRIFSRPIPLWFVRRRWIGHRVTANKTLSSHYYLLLLTSAYSRLPGSLGKAHWAWIQQGLSTGVTISLDDVNNPAWGRYDNVQKVAWEATWLLVLLRSAIVVLKQCPHYRSKTMWACIFQKLASHYPPLTACQTVTTTVQSRRHNVGQ